MRHHCLQLMLVAVCFWPSSQALAQKKSAVRAMECISAEQTGEDVVELAGVTVVELRGDGHHTPAVVEDATGQRHTVTSHTVRKRASEA